MAYSIDINGDILINGFNNGIGVDPYSGLTDLKSVNPISIPNEASVSFSTGLVSAAPNVQNQPATVTTANNLLLIPLSFKTESYQWVTFSSVGSSGLTIGRPYLIFFFGTSGANVEYTLYTTASSANTGGAFPPTNQITISGNSSVTWSTVVPSTINFQQKSKAYNFALDSNGRIWSDRYLTGTGGGTATNSWVYIGNDTDSTSDGNGLLVFTTVHNGTGGTSTPTTFDEWLFVWRRSQIDYTQISSQGSNTTVTWVDGWNYILTTGTTTGHSAYLNTGTNTANPHSALVTPDARANFVDGNYLGNFYQNIPGPGSNYVGFDPTTGGTWTPQTMTAILPAVEVGQCLAFVNQYLLIGTKSNFIYPWDLSPADNTYSTPLIQLPENNTACMVTVGNNAYIFAGTRGNIYVTNGSQASFYKKVPDHISGQVEPYFQWGAGSSVAIEVSPQCATYSKNRLYFGISGSYQAGGNITKYGGLWCVDINSGVIFNAQQMSYGTYNGYISCVSMNTANTANDFSYGSTIGYGLFMGWSDGANPTFGIDVDIATPYINGASMIVSDVIPVGTLLKLMTPYQFEIKTSMPLLTGESIALSAGYSLADYTTGNMTPIGTVSGGANTHGASVVISGNLPTTVQGQQWLIIQATLTGIASNPSYNRLTQIRVIGDTLKTQIPTQPYATQ